MSPAARPTRDDFTPRHQLTPAFSAANQAATDSGNRPVASVIPLNRKPDSVADIGYSAPPPGVIVPFGWQIEQRPDGWLMTHHATEWPVIERIIRERRAGDSYRAIATRLADENAPAPTTGRSHGVWDGGKAGTERARILVHHYAPDVAAFRGPRGAGLSGPMPGAAALDDFEELQRRGAALGLVDDGDDDAQ